MKRKKEDSRARTNTKKKEKKTRANPNQDQGGGQSRIQDDRAFLANRMDPRPKRNITNAEQNQARMPGPAPKIDRWRTTTGPGRAEISQT